MKAVNVAAAAALFVLPLTAQAKSTSEDPKPVETAQRPAITITGAATVASDFGVAGSDAAERRRLSGLSGPDRAGELGQRLAHRMKKAGLNEAGGAPEKVTEMAKSAVPLPSMSPSSSQAFPPCGAERN